MPETVAAKRAIKLAGPGTSQGGFMAGQARAGTAPAPAKPGGAAEEGRFPSHPPNLFSFPHK